MPQGDKSAYTAKQRREAEHIAEGYIKRGGRGTKRKSAPGAPSTPMKVAERTPAPEGKPAVPRQRRKAGKLAASELQADACLILRSAMDFVIF